MSNAQEKLAQWIDANKDNTAIGAYAILSNCDELAKNLAREILKHDVTTLGPVYRLFGAAYERLTPEQRAKDYEEAAEKLNILCPGN